MNFGVAGVAAELFALEAPLVLEAAELCALEALLCEDDLAALLCADEVFRLCEQPVSKREAVIKTAKIIVKTRFKIITPDKVILNYNIY